MRGPPSPGQRAVCALLVSYGNLVRHDAQSLSSFRHTNSRKHRGVATRATRISTSRAAPATATSQPPWDFPHHSRRSAPGPRGQDIRDRERRGQDCVVGARCTAGHGSPLRGARSRLW